MPIHIPVQYADQPQLVDVRVKEPSDEYTVGKVIQVALERGWDFFGWYDANFRWEIQDWSDGTFTYSCWDITLGFSEEIPMHSGGLNDIIFDEKFAKALWGEWPNYDGDETPNPYERWQHHLMQLAVVKDRIKYLGESL